MRGNTIKIYVRKRNQDICILPSLVIKLGKAGNEVMGGHAVQRSLVWKRLGDLLNGVTMTGIWRRRVGNQGYVRGLSEARSPGGGEGGRGRRGCGGRRARRRDRVLACRRGRDPRQTRHPDTMQRPQGLRASRFAASSRPAPSDAASACLLHVGEDVTRARPRPDTPTPCSDPEGLRASIRGLIQTGSVRSDPRGSVHRRGLIQTGSVRRRECMPFACDSVGR